MNYTSIEQSKRLLELGLNPETADMYYFLDPTPAGNIYHLTVQRVDVGVKCLPKYDEGDIPCWSVGALLEVMPQHITRNGTWMKFGIDKGWDGYIHMYYEARHAFVDVKHDSYIEACCKMVTWLFQNNYMKKTEAI